jgi:hypothetical protein
MFKAGVQKEALIVYSTAGAHSYIIECPGMKKPKLGQRGVLDLLR